MIDYHVHLWPHAERADPLELRLERLATYCEQAKANGVEEIALTEHFFRFRQGRATVGDFWLDETDAALSAQMARYIDHHATADLDEYVEAALAAKRAGLPVVVGLEVDYYRDQMDEVAELLRGYPFDVLLGSVHWVGAWMFDNLDDEVSMAEWDWRGTENAWRSYTESLEELAGTHACDVLAHPDLIKLTGRRPPSTLVEECEARMAEAARTSGLAAEVSSAGLRKPVGEIYPSPTLLARFFKAGVPITTASDAHGVGNVAYRNGELAQVATDAGYRSLRAYRNRVGMEVPIDATKIPTAPI